MKKLLFSVLALTFTFAAAGPASASAFTDAFDRPDGNIGSPWVELGGDWIIQDQRALVTNADPFSYATRPGLSRGYKLTSGIVTSPTPFRLNAGVVVNYKDSSNYLFCMIERTAEHSDGLISIGRFVDGVESLRSSKKFMFEPGHDAYTLTVTRVGRNVRCSAAAETIKYALTATDKAAFGRARGVGMRARVADGEDDGLSAWNDFNVVAF